MADDGEIYGIYTRTYGLVKSGTKLTNNHYYHHSFDGGTPFNERERMAVTIAGDDAVNSRNLRTKSQLLGEIARLLDQKG